jgi:hypothetical protein
MKIALCFLISKNNIINKEDIWIKWIEKNKDIINVYIHFNYNIPIKSEWIKKHTLPFKYIVKTSYFHVVPAYMSLLNYSLYHDKENMWFCFLTESCVPIISPNEFRNLFFENHNYSIIRWQNAWWNMSLHKRANLAFLPKEFQLANIPYFVLTKVDAVNCLLYKQIKKQIYALVCKGGLANESIFAIILKSFERLDSKYIKNEISTLIDWSRMTSSTSPYVFKNNENMERLNKDMNWIITNKKKNKYTLFLRKVDISFPDDILNNIIYDKILIDDNEDKIIVFDNKIQREVGEYNSIFKIAGLILFFCIIKMLIIYYSD